MFVLATIQKWGNSGAIRIPKSILETALLKENDKVDIIANRDTITIRKATKKYNNLAELFIDYDGDFKCTEIDNDLPLGKEIF